MDTQYSQEAGTGSEHGNSDVNAAIYAVPEAQHEGSAGPSFQSAVRDPTATTRDETFGHILETGSRMASPFLINMPPRARPAFASCDSPSPSPSPCMAMGCGRTCDVSAVGGDGLQLSVKLPKSPNLVDFHGANGYQ
ncbi:hypothetical protein G7046_g3133 [Stylonectria norvegica]|nr:hypothetical protein G7046_g3133 [Stylonectria norvegica]